jgi:Protein of unknown function (DUF2934)
VVKRLHSAQFAGADTGEIMTDTAEGNLDEKCLMSVSYDGASSQRSGINGLNAHSQKPVQGSGTNPAKTNPRFWTKTSIKNVINTMIKKDRKEINRRPSQTASSTPIYGKKNVGKAASSSTTAKNRARKKAMEQLNEEQVALHAYFIAERRRKLELPGDQTSDWLQAERELLSELRPRQRESNLARWPNLQIWFAIMAASSTRGFDRSDESRTEKSREPVGKRAFVFLRSLI